MSKKYNLRKIKTQHAYSVAEAEQLLRVCNKTILRWFKVGLNPLEHRRPFLIMGEELKRFLKELENRRKIKLKANQFYCFRCRKGVSPQEGSVRIEETGRTIGRERKKQKCEVGNCSLCANKVMKFIKTNS